MMRLKHILGPTMPSNEARIARTLLTPRYHLFIVGCATLIGLLSPLEPLAAAPFLVQFVFWAVAGGIFSPVFALWQVLFLRVYRWLNWRNLPDFVLSLLSLLTVAAVVLPPLPQVGVQVTMEDLLPALLITFLFVQVGTYVYMRFACYVLFPEIYDVETVDGVTLPRKGSEVFLRGTTLPLLSIEVIRADGQYTEVIAGREQQRFRARFSNVVAELPDDLGFQIHRSIWVSRSLALRTCRNGRRLSVHMRNGSQLPVARDRQTEFVNWMSGQGPEFAAHALTL